MQYASAALLFVGNIFHNVTNLTIQNFAKDFNGVGADAFVALEPSNLPWADVVLFNECVLSNTFFLHFFPESVVRNHSFAPLSYLTS